MLLLSNILRDWDIPGARQLVHRCAEALPSGGRLVVHDVFLDDDLSGPLPAALYSLNLFAVTEGRPHSAREIRAWGTESGLRWQSPVPTLIHAAAVVGTK